MANRTRFSRWFSLFSIGVLATIGPLTASTIVHSQARSSTPSPTRIVQTKLLPQSVATAILQDFARRTQWPLPNLKIQQATTATWQDCLAHGIVPPGPLHACQPVAHSGWRVQVVGNANARDDKQNRRSPETWTYYALANGQITLDGPASLSPIVQQALTKQARFASPNLTITAAELILHLSPCPPRALCKQLPIPSWRILVTNKTDATDAVYTIGLQGENFTQESLEGFVPSDRAQLSAAFVEAALQDVRDRLGLLPANLAVRSIQRVAWSDCGGGGPSQPVRGMCSTQTYQGWKVTVRGGPVDWIYYVDQQWAQTVDPSPGRFRLSPDGPQSVPESVVKAVRSAIAQRVSVPPESLRLHWATAKIWNRCLGVPSPALSCRQGLTAGWEVSLLGNPLKPGSWPIAQTLWTYRTNLTGTEVRFMQQGAWLPPP